MKLLLSAYACEPNRGSEPGNGWNWAISTAKMGHEVWCLTTTEGKDNVEKELAVLNMPNLHIVFVSVSDWVEKVYKYQPGVYLHYMMWQQRAFQKAKVLDQNINFDLVHHVTLGSLQMGTALWRLNKPLIFGPTGGGQEAPKAFKKYFYSWWKMEVFRTITSNLLLALNPNVKKAMSHASLVLTTNEDTLRMAKNIGALNPKMFLDTSLPEDFYPEKYPLRKPDKVMKILWVGRLFARKGLPLVLEALSRVHPSVKYELTILGDGPMHDYVPKWIKEFNLEGKVNWKGQVAWDEVKRAYTNSDLFMFCSLRDSSAAQFLESMAYGLPIITLDLHGGKNLVPDNAGIKVSVTTPETTVQRLADAVEKLYKNPDLREQMGKNGYEFSKSQTWPLKTKHINEFYNKYTSAGTKELSITH